MRRRPTFPKISEEMKRWSVLLAEEMKRWPDTRVGRMFGMFSIYRGNTIFALLPDTRGLEMPNAIAIKRTGPGMTEGEKWQSFTIESDNQLGAALERLRKAYQSAE